MVVHPFQIWHVCFSRTFIPYNTCFNCQQIGTVNNHKQWYQHTCDCFTPPPLRLLPYPLCRTCGANSGRSQIHTYLLHQRHTRHHPQDGWIDVSLCTKQSPLCARQQHAHTDMFTQITLKPNATDLKEHCLCVLELGHLLHCLRQTQSLAFACVAKSSAHEHGLVYHTSKASRCMVWFKLTFFAMYLRFWRFVPFHNAFCSTSSVWALVQTFSIHLLPACWTQHIRHSEQRVRKWRVRINRRI